MDYGLMTAINIEHITSPITLVFDGKETKYENGVAAKSARFSKPVLIKEIRSVNGEIILSIKENTQYNKDGWAEDEAVSFF